MTRPKFLVPSLTCLVLSSTQAAITYVDAVKGPGGNTYATGGSLGDTSWVNTVNTGGDEFEWVERPFANNATVFQAFHETVTADTMPELTTTITGLSDGIYQLYVFYWDQVTSDTQNWIISAGLTSGSLTSYRSPGQPAVAGTVTTHVVSATALSFAAPAPITTETVNREMFAIDLGQVTVSGGSPISVYLDNLIGNGSNNRAWYDGVGYEFVGVPEPSSALLLGLGALVLAGRRR